MLTRRPSYRKILNDLGGAEIAGKALFHLLFVLYSQTSIVGLENGIEHCNIKIVLLVVLYSPSMPINKTYQHAVPN